MIIHILEDLGIKHTIESQTEHSIFVIFEKAYNGVIAIDIELVKRNGNAFITQHRASTSTSTYLSRATDSFEDDVKQIIKNKEINVIRYIG